VSDELDWIRPVGVHDGRRFWSPSVGEVLIGRVVDRRTVSMRFGPFEVLVVETDTGERHEVNCGHASLREWLSIDDPVAGDVVGIRYDGQPEGHGKRHTYSAGVRQ
jgi:hypothetical protein